MVEQLSAHEAKRAAALIAALIEDFGLEIYCFSSSIGHTNLDGDTDEAAFRVRYNAALDNALHTAHIMRPRVIRLLAPRLAGESAVARMFREFAWAFASIGLAAPRRRNLVY